MKIFKFNSSFLILVFIFVSFVACKDTPKAETVEKETNTVESVNLSKQDTIKITLGSDDNMKFDKSEINVFEGQTVILTLEHTGTMRVDGNEGSTIHYEPNSYGQWAESKEYAEPAMALEGDAFHYDHREDDDYYTQPGNLFRIMSPAQQQVLFENTARQVGGAEVFIQERHIGNCYKADPAYGIGVAKALGINPDDLNLS